MSMRLVLVALAASLAIYAVPSAAQSASPAFQQESQADRDACTDDAFQHCGDAIPDRDRVYQCLTRKVKMISPACRKVITRPYSSH